MCQCHSISYLLCSCRNQSGEPSSWVIFFIISQNPPKSNMLCMLCWLFHSMFTLCWYFMVLHGSITTWSTFAKIFTMVTPQLALRPINGGSFVSSNTSSILPSSLWCYMQDYIIFDHDIMGLTMLCLAYYQMAFHCHWFLLFAKRHSWFIPKNTRV